MGRSSRHPGNDVHAGRAAARKIPSTRVSVVPSQSEIERGEAAEPREGLALVARDARAPGELVAHLDEVTLGAAAIDGVGDEVLRVPVAREALEELAAA